MATNAIQSRGMAAEQEAVIVIESEREEVCHTTGLVILLLSGTRMMSNCHHQDQYMLDVTRADAARA